VSEEEEDSVTAPEKLDIRTPDGTAEAWAYRPASPTHSGPRPAIVFYVDAGGVRPTMHQMAERLASLGYFVLMPNVYYRAGAFAPFDMKTVFGNPDERARIMGMIKSIDAAAIVRDAGAWLDAIAQQPGVLPGKAGCVGYCMGGRFAFTTAVTHPDRVGAAASIHGGHLATAEPDSLHLKAGQIRARIYLGVADNDGSCTPEHQALLASSLGAAHVDYQLELYAGKGHGFAVPDMPVYDAAAAERHWERLAELFRAALPGAAG
jgi:carboxymethylenebutenolidase